MELGRGGQAALEPKFVLPELGAVGIENTWAVGPRRTELPDAVFTV